MTAHTCDTGPRRTCRACATERKRASRQRAVRAAIGYDPTEATVDGATYYGDATVDARIRERVLVGNAMLDRRGEWNGVPYCVRFNADGDPVEVLYTLRGTAPMRAALEVETRAPEYADGVGDCHDGAHASGAVHPCAHADGAHVRTMVGTYTPRDRWTGLDTVATRRAADIDRAFLARVADDADYKRQARGVTAANTRKPERDTVVTPTEHVWRNITDPRERQRALDALIWAREYHGIIA